MRSVVYQSYRVTNVPGWINRCLKSVESWSARKGFDYALIDDRMFSYAPSWYREKVANNVLLVSDLARLKIAQEYLAQGYQRTIWVDADVLIFDPERFDVPITSEYAFCREVWIEKKTWQERLFCLLTRLNGSSTAARTKVNNAIAVFAEHNSLLTFYVHAAEMLVRNRPADKLTGWDVGVAFLTALFRGIQFPLLTSVAQLSPLLIGDIADNTAKHLSVFAREHGYPVYAANLCSSLSGSSSNGVRVTQSMLDCVVDKLLSTKGGVINNCLKSH